MTNVDIIRDFLNFKIVFSETGLDDKILDVTKMPRTNKDAQELTLSEIVLGFNKYFLGEISAKEFYLWLKVLRYYFALTRKSMEVFDAYARKLSLPLQFYDFEAGQDDDFLKGFREQIIYLYTDEIFSSNKHYYRYIKNFYAQTKHSKKDIDNFIAALKFFIDLGLFELSSDLGGLYYAGVEVEQDYEKAKEYYTKGAKLGSTNSLLNLGYIHYYARCGGEPNYEIAFKCFFGASKVCDKEFKYEALYKLSDMYDHGYYVEKDEDKAFQIVSDLYRTIKKEDNILAVLGDVDVRLGKFYSRQGKYYNPKEALRYYLEAHKIIHDRFDGTWFGDKYLLERCSKNISELTNKVFGGIFPNDTMKLTSNDLISLLNKDKGYTIDNVVYDNEKKEIYFYVCSESLNTIEYIPYVNQNFLMCVVVPVLNATIYKNRKSYVSDYIYFEVAKDADGIKKIDFNDSEMQIGTMSVKDKCEAYIGYITDSEGRYYKDSRLNESDDYDKRGVILFDPFDNPGDPFISLDYATKTNYGSNVAIKDLAFSKELEDELEEALDYSMHLIYDPDFVEEELENLKNDLDKLALKVQQELKDDFVLVYDTDEEVRA